MFFVAPDNTCYYQNKHYMNIFNLKQFLILLTLTFLIKNNTYGQFNKEKIITDSSGIEIIRNSEYIVFEETFKNKDSIWRSVRFIKDSLQIHNEGWRTKGGKYLGTWDEYTYEGELLYSWDYDKRICVVNESLHPYHDLLEQIKKRADSLIISTYSKEFFDNNVHFDFELNAYDDDGYVGNWIEPMERKPTNFIIKYSVKVDSSDWYEKMIGIELNIKGEYISNYGNYDNFGFEKISPAYKTFQINKTKALEIARNNGLTNSETSDVSEFLKWESFKKSEFYNGEFKYYISEFVNEVINLNENGRSRIEYKFNVYYFNPWTGEFLGKKKMKRVKEWEKNSGFTTDLIPDE